MKDVHVVCRFYNILQPIRISRAIPRKIKSPFLGK